MHQGILNYVPAEQCIVVKMWNPENGFRATIRCMNETQMKSHIKFFQKRGYVVVEK